MLVSKGLRNQRIDSNEAAFCPVLVLTTDKRGLAVGIIRVSSPLWKTQLEQFNVTVQYFEKIITGQTVIRKFSPASQVLTFSHTVGYVTYLHELLLLPTNEHKRHFCQPYDKRKITSSLIQFRDFSEQVLLAARCWCCSGIFISVSSFPLVLSLPCLAKYVLPRLFEQ
jgi:hypothetical protein